VVGSNDLSGWVDLFDFQIARGAELLLNPSRTLNSLPGDNPESERRI
jgi:hypothetical protein